VSTAKPKHLQMRTLSIRCLLLCLACLAMAAAVAGQNSARAEANKLDGNPLHEFNSAIRALVRRVSPSVVQVMVTGYGPVEGNRSTTGLTIGRQQNIGSGVIVDADGYIVTNAHVIRGAHRVLVNIPADMHDESPDQTLVNSRGRTVEARIVGSDSDLDLALLKVDLKGLRRRCLLAITTSCGKANLFWLWAALTVCKTQRPWEW
jgi:S1-C subfamily serine protease